jgi:hypothetical protein
MHLSSLKALQQDQECTRVATFGLGDLNVTKQTNYLP